MLTPSICTICEKIIFNTERVPSLINIFSKITLTLPEQEIPRNSVVPKEWAVFSSWRVEPGDETRDYFLCTQVRYPDRTPFGETNRIKIVIEPERQAQIAVQMLAFPIAQPGFYTASVWIEENQAVVVDPIELRVELEIIRREQAQ